MESMIHFFRDTLSGPVYIIYVILCIILIFACIGYLAEKSINKKKEREKYVEVVGPGEVVTTNDSPVQSPVPTPSPTISSVVTTPQASPQVAKVAPQVVLTAPSTVPTVVKEPQPSQMVAPPFKTPAPVVIPTVVSTPSVVGTVSEHTDVIPEIAQALAAEAKK